MKNLGGFLQKIKIPQKLFHTWCNLKRKRRHKKCVVCEEVYDRPSNLARHVQNSNDDCIRDTLNLSLHAFTLSVVSE